MNAATIVGYTHTAEHVCEDCTRTRALAALAQAGGATAYGDCGSAEDILGEWASLVGIDREDEHSFDSGEFPKVIFADSAHGTCQDESERGRSAGECNDRCGDCGEPIGYDCPNVESPW